jgi:hypothetical protein
MDSINVEIEENKENQDDAATVFDSPRTNNMGTS